MGGLSGLMKIREMCFLDWQGQVGKARLARLKLIKNRNNWANGSKTQGLTLWTNGTSRLKREPGQARALAKIPLQV